MGICPEPGFPPKVFLIGAQKCATTYLADLMARHPRLCLSSPKEPDYFSRHRQKGLDWYRQHFADAEGRIPLDASTSYSTAPTDSAERRDDNPRCGVPGRIHALVPDARLIYLVRDPVARTYSAYWHSVRAREERRTDLDAIRATSWYLDPSRYHFQMTEYLRIFPETALLVIDSRELTRDPAGALERIFGHIGLEGSAVIEPGNERRNPSYRYNALGRMFTSLPVSRPLLRRITRALRNTLPPGAFKALRHGLTKEIPPMSEEEHRVTADLLAEDIANFERRTGIVFSRPGPTDCANPEPMQNTGAS